MASEYLKWKARDEKPAPPPRELTKEEKAQNWLYYHRPHLIAGAVLLCILGSLLWSVLGIGRTKPDHIVAYIGRNELSAAAAGELTRAFEALGTDVNGDGRVAVELRQYANDRSGDEETAIYYNSVANTKLMADLTAGDSYFLLVEDPQAVQRSLQIFARADGTPPAEDDYDAAGKVLRLSDCPALAGSLSDPELASSLWLGRRCFYDEKRASAHAADALLWDVLTEGAAG